MSNELSLDQILKNISPGCRYQTIQSSAENLNWKGLWYTEWEPGENNISAPSYAQIEQAANLMKAAGQNQTIESGLSGFAELTNAVAFQKIVASIPQNPSIALLGCICLVKIFMYLKDPTESGGVLARNTWNGFVAYSNSQRAITGVTEQDILDYNEKIDELEFPQWLKLAP